MEQTDGLKLVFYSETEKAYIESFTKEGYKLTENIDNAAKYIMFLKPALDEFAKVASKRFNKKIITKKIQFITTGIGVSSGMGSN